MTQLVTSPTYHLQTILLRFFVFGVWHTHSLHSVWSLRILEFVGCLFLLKKDHHILQVGYIDYVFECFLLSSLSYESNNPFPTISTYDPSPNFTFPLVFRFKLKKKLIVSRHVIACFPLSLSLSLSISMAMGEEEIFNYSNLLIKTWSIYIFSSIFYSFIEKSFIYGGLMVNFSLF